MAASSPIAPQARFWGTGYDGNRGSWPPAGYRTRCHRSRRQCSPIYLFCDKHRTVAAVPGP